MLPPKGRGTITYIAEPGEYNIDVSEGIMFVTNTETKS